MVTLPRRSEWWTRSWLPLRLSTTAPTSYEAMPFVARFASVVAAAGVGGTSLLATVLAGNVLVGLLGSALGLG